MGEQKSEEFWTYKRVRQGCPLSPTLFNVYIADLEREMRKVNERGVRIGREKVWTITYADDIVLVATGQTELKEMIQRFRKYTKKKKLELNTEKSKVLVFEKGRGRKDQRR